KSVPDRAQVAIDALQLRMRIVPLDDLPGGEVECDDRMEVRHHPPDLGVVEHDGVRHVAGELTGALRQRVLDRATGGVAQLRLGTGGAPEDGVDLVPGVDEVTGDLE